MSSNVVKLNDKGKALCDEVWKDTSLWEKNYKLAISLFLKAYTQFPENIVVLTNLGAALSDIGKHRDALSYLQKAERIGTNDSNLYFNIAVAKMNIDSATRKEAIVYFNKASKLISNPMTLRAYFDPMAH